VGKRRTAISSMNKRTRGGNASIHASEHFLSRHFWDMTVRAAWQDWIWAGTATYCTLGLSMGSSASSGSRYKNRQGSGQGLSDLHGMAFEAGHAMQCGYEIRYGMWRWDSTLGTFFFSASDVYVTSIFGRLSIHFMVRRFFFPLGTEDRSLGARILP